MPNKQALSGIVDSLLRFVNKEIRRMSLPGKRLW